MIALSGIAMLLLLAIVGLIVILVIFGVFSRRSGGEHPVCGQCGYAVAGLEVLRCPECGSDLRRVGILTGRMRREVNPTVWAIILIILWSMLLPIPAMVLTSVARSAFPRQRTEVRLVTLGRPDSGAYQSVDINITSRVSQGQTTSRNTFIVLNLNAGTQSPQLDVDLVNLPEDGGASAITRWMTEAGVDAADPVTQSEVGAIVSHLVGFAQGINTTSAGGGFNSSSGSTRSVTDPLPAWFVVGAPLFWLGVWLIPVVWLLQRGIRRHHQARQNMPAS